MTGQGENGLLMVPFPVVIPTRTGFFVPLK